MITATVVVSQQIKKHTLFAEVYRTEMNVHVPCSIQVSLSSYLQDLRIGLVEICARNCLNLLQISAHIFTKRRIICDDPQGSELCDVNGQHAGTKADQRRMKLLRRCVDKKRERVRACADPIIQSCKYFARWPYLPMQALLRSPAFSVYISTNSSRLAA